MSTVTFAAIKSKVEELCTLPSTCPELKAVCREWLAAVGTDRQQEMNTKLLKEVGEDINTLDDVIPFFESAAGKKIFGEETAAQLAKKGPRPEGRRQEILFLPVLHDLSLHPGK